MFLYDKNYKALIFAASMTANHNLAPLYLLIDTYIKKQRNHHIIVVLHLQNNSNTTNSFKLKKNVVQQELCKLSFWETKKRLHTLHIKQCWFYIIGDLKLT